MHVKIPRGYVLISSVTGGGAETAARLLASPAYPWYRGDVWGSRPSGSDEEWTYVDSSFDLPDSVSILTMTDGSDIAPWRFFHRRHPDIPIIRLCSTEADILEWRNRWRAANSLPPRESVGELTRVQRAVRGPADLVVDWPDLFRDKPAFLEALTTMKEYIEKPGGSV